LQEGANLGFGGIFGSFILRNTPNPKVFIATGTGLSPMIHMLEETPEDTQKTVYFSVSTRDELFYEEILASYENTEILISISRENTPGYLHGRIHLDKDFSPDTEFYLCGNPTMIREKTEELKQRGYTMVYSEAFV
jgi:ferredoxin-NADP reductase